jgi:peptidoglycan lytic transglycosylase G
MLGDWLKALLKLGVVLVTLALVGIGIYKGYQYAFPPSEQTGTLTLPNVDLTACTPQGGPFDPTDVVYALQLQQHQDELNRPASSDSKEVNFTVDPGELPADVATKLQNAGFIRDGDLFVTLLKCRHASEKIQAGDHTLRKNMTMDQIVIALEKGINRGISVTIRPGWRAEQIADYLATLNLPQFSKDEFLRLVKQGAFDYAFLQDRPKDAAPSVEGYLFPETYEVLQGITPEQLINRFLSEFDQRITPDMRDQAVKQNLTLYQVITMASIVEREAVKPEEAPIIASVYYNRIKDQMLLNADPTVQYAIGYQAKTNQWWPVVSLQEYARVDSPYNTYIYGGLPPGPICEPSLNSIEAALQPASTDYLYFLAKGDGTHVFAKTLQEQQANLAKYGYQPAPSQP